MACIPLLMSSYRFLMHFSYYGSNLVWLIARPYGHLITADVGSLYGVPYLLKEGAAAVKGPLCLTGESPYPSYVTTSV